MSKRLSELKLSLAKRILDSEDEEQLRTVDQLLGAKDAFRLSAAEKAELDADFAEFKAGKGKVYTWDEVKADARKAIKA